MIHFKNSILPILVALIATTSCIEPVNVKHEDQSGVLTVEAQITTEAKAHLVHLTTSAPYGGVLKGIVKPVENAEVIIKDDIGNTTVLSYDSSGTYHTPEYFKAEVGRSYILDISYDGNEYISLKEKVDAVGTIDELVATNKEVPYLSESGALTHYSGIEVFAKYHRQPNTADYFYWNYTGLYTMYTHPELFIARPLLGLPYPDPKDCCAECYRFEYNNARKISSFDLGQDVAAPRLFFIRDDGFHFAKKYLLMVHRYTLTKGAYQFFKQLNQQLSINGNIFDPPPVTLRGNIYNTNNINETVVGYFVVSDVSTDTLSIYPGDLDNLLPLPIYPDDCRVLPNSSTDKPVFY